jgi:hypothetical protein
MNRLVVIILAAAVLAGFTGYLALKGISRPGPNVSPSTTSAPKGNTAGESALDSVRDALRKSADIEACRTAVQQLNLYLSQNPDKKLTSLSAAEQELLTHQFHLDADELAEVNRSSFTLLDGHHLEFCFLLRDAVRSLRMDDLTPLARVEAGFNWVIRQVGLRERPGDSLPPYFVLRRGWGTSQERALVFLALLEQLGIDGAMIALSSEGDIPNGRRYWVPGALVDKEIYLFDTRLGLPLPGPNGNGVATLTQVRSQPEVLRALAVDDKTPYDVAPEQLKQVEVCIACSLSALAPRMRDLQEVLGLGENMTVAVAPAETLERFRAAVEGPAWAGCKIDVWNEPGNPTTPIRVLRSFLPPEEGGIDRFHRLEQAKMELVPWDYFPRRLREMVELPGAAELGQRLKGTFADPFFYFSIEPRVPSEVLMAWLPGLSERSEEKASGRKPADVLTRGNLPRDLVLRGRFDEAVPLLVAIRRELQSHKKFLADPKLNDAVFQWCKTAIEVYAGLIQAREQARKGGAATVSITEAQQRVDKLWQHSGAVLALVKGAAAEPMSAQVVYLLALCKHEQAERAQIKLDRAIRGGKTASTAERSDVENLWRSAAGWWQSVLDEHGMAPTAPSARILRARALYALGERDSAVALLEDISGLTDLEKTAHLYLAKQWKPR